MCATKAIWFLPAGLTCAIACQIINYWKELCNFVEFIYYAQCRNSIVSLTDLEPPTRHIYKQTTHHIRVICYNNHVSEMKRKYFQTKLFVCPNTMWMVKLFLEMWCACYGEINVTSGSKWEYVNTPHWHDWILLNFCFPFQMRFLYFLCAVSGYIGAGFVWRWKMNKPHVLCHDNCVVAIWWCACRYTQTLTQ